MTYVVLSQKVWRALVYMNWTRRRGRLCWELQDEPFATLPRRAWVRLNHPLPVSDVSAPACTNGVWPPLRPVSVAQNKPSTMLSSNVQSIDLPMDCTAWRFWTMRQLNGCSIPAPKSSAAKQWIKELAQKLNLQKFSFVGKHCLAGKSWKTYLEVTTVEASIPNCTVQFSKTFSCELLWRCDHWSATYNVEFVTIVE